MEDLEVREIVIEKYLVTELRKVDHRIICKKLSGPGWRGWADRLVLLPCGLCHWLEIKRPKGGKFEPLQLRNHRMLHGMGFLVRVVNTKALVDEYTEETHEYLRAIRRPGTRS